MRSAQQNCCPGSARHPHRVGCRDDRAACRHPPPVFVPITVPAITDKIVHSQHHLRSCDATVRPPREVNCSISVSGGTTNPLRCVPETPTGVLCSDTPIDLREVRGEGHGSIRADARFPRSATTLGRPRTRLVRLAARRRAATRRRPTRWTTGWSDRWSRTATHPVRVRRRTRSAAAPVHPEGLRPTGWLCRRNRRTTPTAQCIALDSRWSCRNRYQTRPSRGQMATAHRVHDHTCVSIGVIRPRARARRTTMSTGKITSSASGEFR